jgi:hypothetical protein
MPFKVQGVKPFSSIEEDVEKSPHLSRNTPIFIPRKLPAYIYPGSYALLPRRSEIDRGISLLRGDRKVLKTDLPMYCRRACNSCRQRKVKCNGRIPCLSCSTSQLSCVYSQSINRRGPKVSKRVPRSDICETRQNSQQERHINVAAR